MAEFDHAVLVLCMPTDNHVKHVSARYSRCKTGMPQSERWSYFDRQVREAYPGADLLAVVDDLPHEHPLVITAEGVLPNDDTAHMP